MIFKENEVKTTEIEKRAEGGVIGTENRVLLLCLGGRELNRSGEIKANLESAGGLQPFHENTHNHLKFQNFTLNSG